MASIYLWSDWNIHCMFYGAYLVPSAELHFYSMPHSWANFIRADLLLLPMKICVTTVNSWGGGRAWLPLMSGMPGVDAFGVFAGHFCHQYHALMVVNDAACLMAFTADGRLVITSNLSLSPNPHYTTYHHLWHCLSFLAWEAYFQNMTIVSQEIRCGLLCLVDYSTVTASHIIVHAVIFICFTR